MLWNIRSSPPASRTQGQARHSVRMLTSITAEAGSPSNPRFSSVLDALTDWSHRICWFTASFTPRSSAISTISTASAYTFESGFWHSRCLPAAVAFRTSSFWCQGGTAMSTISTAGSSSSDSTVGNTLGTSKSRAVRFALSMSLSVKPITLNPALR